MMRIPVSLSPSYPAVCLVFGLIFAFAATYFLAVPWSQAASKIFYLVTFAWVMLITWQHRGRLRVIGLNDVLFLLFLVIVMISLFIHPGGMEEGVRHYIRYLPFLMVTPYLCGRLFKARDTALFKQLIVIIGVALIPLLLLYSLDSPQPVEGRWPFFGMDHGPLLAGALLAATLLALSHLLLEAYKPGKVPRRSTVLVLYGLIVLVTVFLVWVGARGWLLACLLAIPLISGLARFCASRERIGLVLLVYLVAALSLIGFTRLDSVSGRQYALPVSPQSSDESASICLPLEEGKNSVAIRFLLYRESVAMFLQHPISGVGAARFGEHSCSGPMGLSHSTLLQGFAELGLIGGSLLVMLLIATVVTLVRNAGSGGDGSDRTSGLYILVLFFLFLMTDQIYGNYFTSAGTWLIAGIAAGIRVDMKPGVRYV